MKIGLVLSGGGARGIAHLGLLRGLDEIGIGPQVISGVSSGALIGALYAAGQTPGQILELVKAHSSSSIIRSVLFPSGLFTASGLTQLLRSVIPVDDFNQLHIPLFVTATDIASGMAITFSKGHLYDALIGSSAMPGLFTPIHLDHYALVDGGVLDNFPVECIRNRCDKIIGSHVNKLFFDQRETPGRQEIVEKCFHLAIARGVAANALLCDLFVEPVLKGHSMFDLKSADEIFDRGYQAVMEHRDMLLSWKVKTVNLVAPI